MTVMYRLLVLFVSVLSSVSLYASEYPKAILQGDYPDPSILRDGKDYYMTHSPLLYKPGFLIWHSTDLVNWEPLCRAVDDFKGSAWAPDLVKHGDRYYIYFPSDNTNWVTWADNIAGPWSEPVDLKVGGIDPGHMADRDGNRYLFVNTGEVIRLAPDGLSTEGEKTRVYEGWKYPDEWITEGMFLESPKLTYHDGYYYMISAQGGTAGPPTSHMAICARSREIMGPWENSPYNPVIHTYSADEQWWSKGHGTIVDDVNGNWWIVYHAYPNGFHTLGRCTLLEPLDWTADGWCHTVAEAKMPLENGGVVNGMKLSDDFDTDSLGLQWTSWGENAAKVTALRDGKLMVDGKGLSPSDGRLITIIPQHKDYEVMTEVTVGDGCSGGLLLFYTERAYAGLLSDGKSFKIYENSDRSSSVKSDLGRHFYVKLHNDRNRLAISVSKDGADWISVAEDIDVSQLHHNNYGAFSALRPALCVTGDGTSYFHSFRYNGLD